MKDWRQNSENLYFRDVKAVAVAWGGRYELFQKSNMWLIVKDNIVVGRGNTYELGWATWTGILAND